MLFGLLFILAGLAVGAFVYFPAIFSWWSARSWEEVPCWIETAELKTSHSTKGGTSYRVEASYRYEFDRHWHQSREVSFLGSGSDNMGSFQRDAYQQLKPLAGKDQPFRCYVNPFKPEQVVLFRDLRWGLLLLMSIFLTVFPLVGFLVSVGGWRQSRKAALNQKLAAQHPGEPWRWRSEWAGDTIEAAKDSLPSFLGVAGWILAVQLPLVLAVVLSGELTKSALALFALLPSFLAMIPLLFAWKRVKSRLAFGHPTLRLKRFPAEPGSILEGDLRFDRVLSPMSTVYVRVLCQRHITRISGNARTTAKETIWERAETLPAAVARRDISGVSLPLHLEIPRGLPCSTVDECSTITTIGERHVWTMEISSSQGGTSAVLPLPVFSSKDEVNSADSVPNHPPEVVALSTDDLVARLQARGIRAEFDSSGIPMLLDCPAGRNRAMGVFLLLFGSVWFAAFVLMLYQGAPLLFRLVWGTTSPLILGAGVWTLLQSRRVEFTAGELRILNRIGPLYSWRETFAPHHFTGFIYDTNMQSGNQFFYRVRGETIFGQKKTTLIDGITESVTAEALVQRLEPWRKRG